MFHYYGGKKRLADKYPPPTHPLIVEPFAGGAAYTVRALRLGLAERGILFDTDPRVVEMWHRLLELGPDGIAALPDIKRGQKTPDPLHITVAASNCWGSVKTITVTQRMEEEWPSMRRGMAAVAATLKGRVEIHQADYSAADVGEACYFIDPPYQTVRLDGSEPTGGKRGKGYLKGSNSDSLNFAALRDWTLSLQGQVIVAEQVGADWLPFEPLSSHQNSKGVLQVEVVWLNEIARAGVPQMELW